MIKIKLLVACLVITPVLLAQPYTLRKSIVFENGNITSYGDANKQELLLLKNSYREFALTDEGLMISAFQNLNHQHLGFLKSGRVAFDLRGLEDRVHSVTLRPVKIDKKQWYGIHMRVDGPSNKIKFYLLLVNKNRDCQLLVSELLSHNDARVLYLSKQNDWVRDDENKFAVEKFGNHWKFLLNGKLIYETTETVAYRFFDHAPEAYLQGAGQLLLRAFRFEFHGLPAWAKAEGASSPLFFVKQPDPDMPAFTSLQEALDFIKQQVQCGNAVLDFKISQGKRETNKVYNATLDYSFTEKDVNFRYSYHTLMEIRSADKPGPGDTLQAVGNVMHTGVEFPLLKVGAAQPMVDEENNMAGLQMRTWLNVKATVQSEQFRERIDGKRFIAGVEQDQRQTDQFVVHCYDKKVSKHLSYAFWFANQKMQEKIKN